MPRRSAGGAALPTRCCDARGLLWTPWFVRTIGSSPGFTSEPPCRRPCFAREGCSMPHDPARVPNEERAMSGQGRDSMMERQPRKAGAVEVSPHDDAVRQRAIEERRTAARREKLRVRPDSPPFLRVEAPSGFAYRIHLRGGT